MGKLNFGTPECNRPSITRVITFVTDRGYLTQSMIAASQLAAQPDVVAIADIIIYLIDIMEEEEAEIRAALGPSRFNFLRLDSKDFIPESVDRLPDLHVPHSTLGRLVLDAEIPAQYDTVIYMDGDIQIIGPVAPLVAHNCAPGTVLAGSDRLDHGGKYGVPRAYLKSLGVNQLSDYFNAGIVMAPRKAWKTFTSEALSFLTCYPELCKHYDQSALNAVIGTHRECMDPAYNYTTWFQIADHHRSISPRIVHFTGPSKPWNSTKGPWGTRFRKVYADFLAEFPYFEQYLKIDASKDIDPKCKSSSLTLRIRCTLKSIKEATERRWRTSMLRRFQRDAVLIRFD